MALRLRDISLGLDDDEVVLPQRVAAELGIDRADICSLRVVRRGIDARHKGRIVRVFTVEFKVRDEVALLARHPGNPRFSQVAQVLPLVFESAQRRHRAIVVGMGPAGLFAALQLARCGVEVLLLEQGRPVEERVRDVERFWQDGILDERSNVQFGEGGAGTFSDGKLTTRVNHPATRLILQTLVECGAPEAILVEAKPHVGSDRLRLVLIRLRQLLQRLGVTIRFETRLTGLLLRGSVVTGGVCGDEELPADSLVLAPGHSARDTYRMLDETGVRIETKPFAVGFRVEHPAGLINAIQYGRPVHPGLPTAEYALAWNNPASGRGVYSFCMCPGGEVVIGSSEAGGVVVNGMSRLKRANAYSNSALVVTVRPEDFPGHGPLAGVAFQRHWEEAAFLAGGRDYRAPAQNLLAYLGRGKGPLHSTARPGVREADLSELLPTFVGDELRQALPQFDRRMHGFITGEATLVGVETRTSSPLRIVRGDDGQSVSHPGLYPAGEGAGYAGGIVSAALDGLRVAEKIVARVNRNS